MILIILDKHIICLIFAKELGKLAMQLSEFVFITNIKQPNSPVVESSSEGYFGLPIAAVHQFYK